MIKLARRGFFIVLQSLEISNEEAEKWRKYVGRIYKIKVSCGGAFKVDQNGNFNA